MTYPFRGHRPNVPVNEETVNSIDEFLLNNENEEVNNLDLIQTLFEQKRVNFIQDSNPCYYIYRLESQFSCQTGLVALISLDSIAYKVYPHEQTEPDKIYKYSRFLESEKVQANPVILLHRFSKSIQKLMDDITQSPPLINISTISKCNHKLWVIHQQGLVEKISQHYSFIDKYYIADGHHRHNAVKSVLEKHGECHMLSWLIPESQAYAVPYYWSIPNLGFMNPREFLKVIEYSFDVILKTDIMESQNHNNLFMYLDKSWYLLLLKKPNTSFNVTFALDNILRKKLKLAIFSVQIDKVKLTAFVEKLSHKVGFLLPSINISDILQNIDQGCMFPVNTTYFVPKPAIGLINYVSKK